jgi:hypothetical protein
MRRRIGVAFVVTFTGCLSMGLLVGAARPADSPVRVRYLGRLKDKGITSHYFRISLKNRQEMPVWFVLPYYAHDPLPKDGLLVNDTHEQPFTKVLYGGQGGTAVEVKFDGGMLGHKLTAFRLPPKGRLILEKYRIGAWTRFKFSKFVVWETPVLKVNGKTPLENWLPFRTTSAKKVKVTNRSQDLSDTTPRTKQHYPKDHVEKVKAEGFRIWTVKFRPKP